LPDLPFQWRERPGRKLDNRAVSNIANVKRAFFINGYGSRTVDCIRNRLERIVLT
jgi:hypothetical protein